MILQKSPFTCTHLHTHMYVTRQGGTCDAAIVAKKPYHIAEEPYIILQKSPFTYTHILTHTYTHTHVARQGDACDAAIVVVAGRLCMREGRTKKGDLTHSYAWHDPFICVTWLIHMCDMTQSYVRHDWWVRVTWLIHMCDMAHLHVWHDSRCTSTCDVRAGWLRMHAYSCVR